MEWNDSIIDQQAWFDSISNRERKEHVAKEIAAKVEDGDVIGVGSGSTSYLALLAIAERVKSENLNILAIPTSLEISMTCAQLGVRQSSLLEKKPDWAFDGADEVDVDNSLIKGRGGAMFKEKLLILNSEKTYIIIDDSKFVSRLGSKFPVPIEIFPSSLLYVEKKIKGLGATQTELRMAKGKDGPVITENGNLILDAWFDLIDKDMENRIKMITGVIESGLFIGYDVEIIVS